MKKKDIIAILKLDDI